MTGEKEIRGILNGFHFSICQFEFGGLLLSSYGGVPYLRDPRNAERKEEQRKYKEQRKEHGLTYQFHYFL